MAEEDVSLRCDYDDNDEEMDEKEWFPARPVHMQPEPKKQRQC